MELTSEPNLFTQPAGSAADADDAPKTATPPRPLLALRRLHLGRLAFVFVLLGLLWRFVHYIVAYPVWGDEGFVAVNFLVRDAAGMLKPLEWGQIVPAGFMWLGLAAYRVFGASEWALRLPAFVAGCAALMLFYRFARSTVSRPAALLAVGILAAAYYPVRHTAEIKPYAQDMLVSLCLTMLAWAIYRRPRNVWAWIGLILFAAAAPWLSYPSAFVGGAAGLLLTWLLLRERLDRRLLVGWALFGLVLLGSFIAMYRTYGLAQAEYGSRLVEIEMWKKAFPPVKEPLKLLGWMAWVHSGNMLAYPMGSDYGGSTLTLLLVIVGTIQLWRRERPLCVLLITPLGLALFAAAIQRYPYGASARTSLYMAPAFCLLAGVGAWTLIARFVRYDFRLHTFRIAGRSVTIEWGRGPLVRLLAMAILVLLVVGPIYSSWRRGRPSPEQTSRDAIVDLRSRTQAGDRWLVFNAIEPSPDAPWLGDWKGTGGQFVFDVVRFAPSELAWAAPPQDVNAGVGRVWLIAYRGVKVDFPQQQFDAYLERLKRNFAVANSESWLIKARDGREERIDVWLLAPKG
ncbi:MAG: glycosyltransferase family 39 protein [Planctomycetes bacterium]|nr:glycosyltransferase family 39 protein [Planctomycetota bacterium]